MSYCQECTERFDDGFRFCPDCGTRLTAPAQSAARSTDETGSGWGADSPESSSNGAERNKARPSAGEASTNSADTPPRRGTNREQDSASTQWESTGTRPAANRNGKSFASPRRSGRSRSAATRSSPIYTQPYHDGVDFEAGNLAAGAKYPKTAGWLPTLIGGACLLFDFLLVPFVLFLGYSVRLAQAAMLEQPSAPGYSDIGGLTLDGLRVVGAYLPVTIAGGLLVWAPLQFELGGLALLAFGLSTYVGGAVLPTLAATGTVLETYRDARFLRFAVTIDYLKVFLALVGVTIGLSVFVTIAVIALALTVVGLLVAIPLLILTPAIQAYIAYAGCVALARAYEDAAEDGSLPSMTTTE